MNTRDRDHTKSRLEEADLICFSRFYIFLNNGTLLVSGEITYFDFWI
jgi:hypothetical protein